VGAVAGWAAITRPLDAICFAAPVAVAMLIDLRREKRGRAIAAVGIAIACAAPFLAMQLAIDRAYTGRWLQTPVQKYEELYWPGLEFGFHPKVLPGEHAMASDLPQFRHIHEYFVKTFFAPASTRGGAPARYLLAFEYGLAQPLLLVLLPVGVLGLGDRRRWPLWVAAFVFPLAYLAWVQFIRHYARYYCTVISPALALAAVLGARQIAAAYPARRNFLSAWMWGAIVVLAAMALPEFGAGKDRTNSSPPMQALDRWASKQQLPALVFIRSDPDDANAWRHEQVYNVEAAEIDGQHVVRAQDMGARDIELVRYYAAKQPGREVFRFENGMKQPQALGNVREVAERPELLGR
jgi:hypothetical protein